MPKSFDLRFVGKQPLIGDVRLMHHERHVSGNLTANVTTRFVVATPCIAEKLFACRVSVEQVPVDADGTLTVQFRKYDASANAFVNLTTAFNTEGLTTKESAEVPLIATLNDADLVVEKDDVLYCDVVSNSAAIDTQPTNLALAAFCTAVAAF